MTAILLPVITAVIITAAVAVIAAVLLPLKIMNASRTTLADREIHRPAQAPIWRPRTVLQLCLPAALVSNLCTIHACFYACTHVCMCVSADCVYARVFASNDVCVPVCI